MDELARHWRRQQRWLDEHRKRMAERRGAGLAVPPAFSVELWRDCTDIAFDQTGKAAQIHTSRLPAVWRAMILRAAFGELDGGEVMRDWSSERARNIAICGLIVCRVQRPTRRRGRWTGLVRGFTRGAFAAACKGPRGLGYHLNTILGIHRPGATDASSQIGYLDALERVGLIYRQRLPALQVSSEERWRGRDGKLYACNRYWLTNPNPYDGHLRADVRAAMIEHARAATRKLELRLRRRTRTAAPSAGPAVGTPDAPALAAPD